MNQSKFLVFLAILSTIAVTILVGITSTRELKEEVVPTVLQSSMVVAHEQTETTTATTTESTTEETTTKATTTSKPSTRKETTTEKKIITTTTTTIPETVQLDSQNVVDLGEFTLTAYCPCSSCSGPYGRSTAYGPQARANHTVAVDPSVIPYGSHLIINGHEYVAEDCGSAVKSRKVDIFFDTHSEAEAFGLQHAHVYLIVE